MILLVIKVPICTRPLFPLQAYSEEKRFKPILNERVEDNPNLLQTIPVDDLRPHQIRFYAQDQIAGIGEKGKVFILTFLDNRIFHASIEEFPNEIVFEPFPTASAPITISFVPLSAFAFV